MQTRDTNKDDLAALAVNDLLSQLPVIPLEKRDIPAQFRDSAIETKLLQLANLPLEPEIDILRAILVELKKVKA